MKGSIRVAIGFLVVFGAVGGLDNVSDGQLFPLVAVAVLGLAIMASGLSAMKGV